MVNGPSWATVLVWVWLVMGKGPTLPTPIPVWDLLTAPPPPCAIAFPVATPYHVVNYSLLYSGD